MNQTYFRASANWTKHLPLLRDDNTTDNEDLVMASSSANGIVKIWRISIRDSLINPKTECIATIDHAEEDEDVPQVYALQFITQWMGTTSTEDCAHSTASATRSLLLTSSDDKIHLWELFIRTNESENTNDSNSSPSHSAICFRKMLTYHFVCLQKGNGGVVLKIGSDDEDVIPHSEPSCLSAPQEQHVFGGDRNPNNVIYVFDASHCHANGLLAVGKSSLSYTGRFTFICRRTNMFLFVNPSMQLWQTGQQELLMAEVFVSPYFNFLDVTLILLQFVGISREIASQHQLLLVKLYYGN